MGESVWDYPRPPRVEAAARRIAVMFAGVTIADSTRAWRVLETSHPPVYYVPREDVVPGAIASAGSPQSSCEFKGLADYLDVSAGGRTARRAAWTYERPSPGYVELAGAIAFYPSAMDACTVDGVPARAQEGDFYGGWITPDIEGPFKGGPGTRGW